jgi:hypothetical protein
MQKLLIDASKEVGLEINIEKTKYMLQFRHQNAGQNWDIKTGNGSLENVLQYIYLVMLATIQSRTFCLLVCCREI